MGVGASGGVGVRRRRGGKQGGWRRGGGGVAAGKGGTNGSRSKKKKKSRRWRTRSLEKRMKRSSCGKRKSRVDENKPWMEAKREN